MEPARNISHGPILLFDQEDKTASRIMSTNVLEDTSE